MRALVWSFTWVNFPFSQHFHDFYPRLKLALLAILYPPTEKVL